MSTRANRLCIFSVSTIGTVMSVALGKHLHHTIYVLILATAGLTIIITPFFLPHLVCGIIYLAQTGVIEIVMICMVLYGS